MTISESMSVLQEAMIVAVKISAPFLLVSMFIGLLISVFQAATQIHEQTLTFLPKLLVISTLLIVTGGWMLDSMVDFSKYIFSLMIW